MKGSVTKRKRANAPAPSSSAASYRSRGTSSSEAMKITIRSPTHHSASSVSDGFDQAGSLNHPGCGSPSRPRMVFTAPVPGLSRKTKAIVPATGGARYGA